MKISWSWMAEYLDTSGLTAERAGELLTQAGLEVEGVERVGDGLAPVVVGEILSLAPHPEADRLVLAQVRFDGEPVQIVCGARNMKAGDRVPVIPAGERLPDGTKIKRGKIRGELSNGMMCSERELGLGEGHEGLMILPGDAPVGASLAEYMALRDEVLDLSVTPNRGDALSYLGVARELAALAGASRRFPGALGGHDPLQTSEPPASGEVVVEVGESAGGCPRYAAAVVHGLRVAPSPAWLVRRLEAIGQRPVNNLVDVTNYVMFETGQPLHVFDLERLAVGPGGKRHIVVRRAHPGETLESLDHVVRTLEPGDVVITDGQRPVALAGVMGGVDTEVSDGTTSVLVECAHFDPQAVRKTSRRLGLKSESSYRFERTVDPNGVATVLRRCVELILATQPEGSAPRVASGSVDEYPEAIAPRPLTLRISRTNAVLGVSLGGEEIARLLRAIDLPVEETGGDDLRVTAPTFRPDLEREIDLIEEVGRLYGFDRIPARLPLGRPGERHVERAGEGGATGPALPQPIVTRESLERVRSVRALLASEGLSEAVNYSFVGAETLAALRFGASDVRSRPVPIANPLSAAWSVLRTSLLGGLLTNLGSNLARQVDSAALFEVGPVFWADDAGQTLTGVSEHVELGVVAHGPRPTAWDATPSAWGARDMVALVRALGALLRAELALANHDGAVPYLHPGAGVVVSAGGREVGVAGELHPEIARELGAEGAVGVVSLDLEALLAAPGRERRYQGLSRFPASRRDLAFLVPAALPYAEIEAAIGGFRNELVESVTLASVYAGDPIPAGKKSVAISVTYRSDSASLTDKKIDAVHARLSGHLLQALNAEAR
jgi:phenylalanyl-tRNA synthetase beta chain